MSWRPDQFFRGNRDKKAREKARKSQDSESIDDLLVQGRFSAAMSRLEAQIATNPEDAHSRIKLAEILANRRKPQEAVTQYTQAAQILGDDGFFDKALALLKSARKLQPNEPNLNMMEEQILRSKELDQAAWQVRRGMAGEGAASRLAASIELEALWRRMGESEFVQSLGPGQLEALMDAMELVPVSAGGFVVRQEDDRRELFLIASGMIQARLDPEGRDLLLRNFGPGQIIGEGVLFERKAWPASYKAAHNSQLLKLDVEGAQRALGKTKSRRRLIAALSSQHNDQQVAALASTVGLSGT